MGAARPKQYLELGGRTLLERAIDCLLADARVARVFAVHAPDDPFAVGLRLPARCELLAAGGATRAATVRGGLRLLAARARAGDWVLVHDAARPCLARGDLAALIDAALGVLPEAAEPDGALLAALVSDTVKRGEAGRVVRTEERAGLWRALTPQIFRIDVLARALDAGADALSATDESAAVEALGLRPRLVAGAASNIKITTPEDLALAEAILRMQGRW